VSRGREEQAPAAYDQEAPPQPTRVAIEQIKELAGLREQGFLTEEEFAAEKRKLLEL
jgi:putative oligomerization/nucleic acid binding protein